MSDEMYTLEQLNEMIELATRLRFWDDVKHWRAMRARLEAAAEVTS